MAGLLHDVGRLVLYSQAPEQALEVFEAYRRGGTLLREAEVQVLGYDHAQIGEGLLLAWHYPLNLVEAVACHHRPQSAGAFHTEAALVHLADHLVNAMQIGSSGERYVPALQTKAWDQLNLPVSFLETLVKSIDEQMEIVGEVFLHGRQMATR